MRSHCHLWARSGTAVSRCGREGMQCECNKQFVYSRDSARPISPNFTASYPLSGCVRESVRVHKAESAAAMAIVTGCPLPETRRIFTHRCTVYQSPVYAVFIGIIVVDTVLPREIPAVRKSLHCLKGKLRHLAVITALLSVSKTGWCAGAHLPHVVHVPIHRQDIRALCVAGLFACRCVVWCDCVLICSVWTRVCVRCAHERLVRRLAVWRRHRRAGCSAAPAAAGICCSGRG